MRYFVTKKYMPKTDAWR